MTAIVGIASGGRTWIGWDSCVSDEHERATTSTAKGWRAGSWLVGAAGNGAWCTLLRSAKPPATGLEWPRAIMQAAAQLGLTLPAAKDDPCDGSALVGRAGELWYVDSDLTADAYTEMAAGSGGIAARAVLYVTRGRPRARILKALETAAAIVPGVAPPFTVESA